MSEKSVIRSFKLPGTAGRLVVLKPGVLQKAIKAAMSDSLATDFRHTKPSTGHANNKR